jgi:hypothetical protein
MWDAAPPARVASGPRVVLAESAGFEPAEAGYASTVFKTVTFGRSVNSPRCFERKAPPCDYARRERLAVPHSALGSGLRRPVVPSGVQAGRDDLEGVEVGHPRQVTVIGGDGIDGAVRDGRPQVERGEGLEHH